MKTHQLIVYRSPKTKLWHWGIRARNGNKVANGGEGYSRRVDALKSLRSMLSNAVSLMAQVVEAGRAKY